MRDAPPVRFGVEQVRKLKSDAAFEDRCSSLDIAFPRSGIPNEVLATPFLVGSRRVGNRFCVLPMEGWDGTADGRPTENVERRWSRFGASGAKLVWGGEAVAVRHDGRANQRQLNIGPESVGDLSRLRELLVSAHRDATGTVDELVIGLQLTHSGRWANPAGTAAPKIAFQHPFLDDRVGARAGDVVSDGWLDDLVGDFVEAARVAFEAGFDFVDVKHCHGYLLHELLSATERPGPYGGGLTGRTRFLGLVTEGIRRDAPGLMVGVRLSAFDLVPHCPGPDRVGTPVFLPSGKERYRFAFGGDGTGLGIDLTEVHAFCELLVALGIPLLCVTAGSPYYSPHIQRPAYFPPSDGYLAPRDPLIEVARMIDVTSELATSHPALSVVASGLTYLQEWLPGVAAGIVAGGGAASIGYGRGVLAYPGLPNDVLGSRPLARSELCRTFSDCTTAPRHGLVSGCYPIDPFYKSSQERVQLTIFKKQARDTD